MSKVYFGKFDSKRPHQIQEKYYAAGAKGSSWYGGIEPGDYVFVVTNANVIALWKVREYGHKVNPINPSDTGVVFSKKSSGFRILYPSCNLLKVHISIWISTCLIKLTKLLQVTVSFPLRQPRRFPRKLGSAFFTSVRRYYVTLSSQLPPVAENDIMVVIDNLVTSRIVGILEWKNGQSQPYASLQKLYEDKNSVNERYTLLQLLEFAEEEAPIKRNYLKSVLNELEKQGYFVVDNPIRLYDNVLVGRRKTPISKPNMEVGTEGKTPITHTVESSDIEDAPELFEQYRAYAELLDFNPNLILYGPPGTGKTFATKNIIEAFEYTFRKRYIPFVQVEREERVRFITFHQSYSYEEFIEGIRPQLEEDMKQDEAGGEIRYRVEPGVLEKMVEDASAQIIKAESESSGISGAEFIHSGSRVWKVSLGRRNSDHIYNQCKAGKQIAVDFLDHIDLTDKSYDEIYSLLENERDDGAQKPTMDANTLDTLINQMERG
ncbi:hypothetical protein VQ056_13970 [Paenibacillus sp. JTLBN-2024]